MHTTTEIILKQKNHSRHRFSKHHVYIKLIETKLYFEARVTTNKIIILLSLYSLSTTAFKLKKVYRVSRKNYFYSIRRRSNDCKLSRRPNAKARQSFSRTHLLVDAGDMTAHDFISLQNSAP